MADSTIKILCMVFFLVFISQGNSHCTLRDLSLSQNQTGARVQGKPEWGVNITNNCACVQSNVKLHCRDFRTIERIDPSVLSVSGDDCLVIDGQPIYRDAVTFKYAWDQPFPLYPIYSEISCS